MESDELVGPLLQRRALRVAKSIKFSGDVRDN